MMAWGISILLVVLGYSLGTRAVRPRRPHLEDTGTLGLDPDPMDPEVRS